MRFRSLYRYSFGKSPKDLRPAVIACKLALSLAIVSLVLFVVALFSFFYFHYNSQQSHSSESSGDTVVATTTTNANATSESDTFARQQEYDHSSLPLVRYFAHYSVPLCLFLGAVLSALTLASIGYAYLTYRRYLQTRLVSYQLVNRSFDQLQLEQLARAHVRQPIITKQVRATVLVPKDSPVPEWLKPQDENESSRSKWAIWARSKWSRANRASQPHNNNPKRPISKDMTI